MPRRTTSIHIKNLADGVRHEELRHAFGKFGRVADVTVPVNYHTGRPKGFAFVEFEDPRDAEDAVYHMNKTRFAGREISVEFTRGTRKTPAEMRARDSGSRSGRSWRSRSRSRTPRRRRSSRDRSDSRDGRRRRDYRRRSYSRSPVDENGRSGRRRDSVDDRRSRSPSAERSPSRGRASRSRSPRGRYSQSPGRSRSPSPRSRSGSHEPEVDRKAIRKQLEFYFSDANLSHDGFFCSQLKQSPDGSISFDLLLRCNKLRALGATTKEHLLEALERSKLLKINDLGTGIQRVKPYNSTPTPPECIVLATGLNFLNSSRAASSVPMDQGKGDGQDDNNDAEEVFQEQEEEGVGGGGCGLSTDEVIDFLKGQLKEYGKVKYVHVPRFKTSGSLRGFAFVEFGSKKGADSALSALTPTEEDLVPAPPMSASMKGKKTTAVGEADGWMPKTAPYATSSLSLSERLARQMVWRCCTRRSKQERAAFRRLLHAGYRRSNPLDTEYHLITEGYSTHPATEEGNTTETALEERKERLRLLPYSDWELWRARFYQWQRAWVTRMNAKAEKLTAQAERRMRAVNAAASSSSGAQKFPIVDSLTLPHPETAKTTTAVAGNGSPLSTGLSLPSSYSPGTVVEVIWPLDAEVVNQDLRKQMRQVRLAIEAGVLQPHSLLHSVVHFDTQSSQRLLPLPLHRPQQPPSSTATARVYIRFREPPEAKAFVSAIAESGSGSSADGVDIEDASRRDGCSAEILESDLEAEYCAAIAASKAGAAERRRRAQAAKRRKKVNGQNVVTSPS